jgi:hypothetical protein
MIDQKTVNRDYPLPHADNKLREDVVRINDAFVNIDTDVNDLYATTGTLSTALSTQVASLTKDTQNGSLLYADSTGDGTAYQVVLNPAATVLNTGLLIHMKAHVQNTGPATLNVNSLGIKAIKNTDGSDLKAGDIVSGSACFLFYDGIYFQLINPKMDQVQTELNTSNIMRAFEEIQENHGGSLLMEAGWSDSFSNPDEQGADEGSSSGFQHDPTSTLYKGIDPGVSLNSDKDYDIEANYLQQEFNNSNLILSQSTFTNGSTTVTLNTGAHNWPNTCDKARIKNNVDGIYYNIVSGEGTNSITLETNYLGSTDAIADWTIVYSNLSSGAKLNYIVSSYGSDITGGKTVLVDSEEHSGTLKENAIDNVNTTSWVSSNSAFPHYITIDFGSGKMIGQIKLTGRHNMQHLPTLNSPKDWLFQGSNDNSNWTTIDTQSGISWGEQEIKTFNSFSNSTNYRYYRLYVTDNNNDTNNHRTGFVEVEMMEVATSDSPTVEYISICDKEIQKTDSAAWSDINSAAVTETLNSQKVYYWLMLDPAFSFGVGTEIKVFNSNNLVWRKIAKNDAGTWQYNNDATDTAAEDWVSSTVDDMLHAVSEAISTQAGNRMAGANLSAISDAQWEGTGGWSTSVNSIIRGLTLYSNSSTQNPSVFQYRLNYDSERGGMDLRSKTYDPGFVPSEGYVWSRIEHSDFDGSGTFYVSRNGGNEWTLAPMAQQGLPLSGDIRIYRGIVDVNSQASGQDLRCRYQSSQGKDQFLHSWGLQAKS